MRSGSRRLTGRSAGRPATGARWLRPQLVLLLLLVAAWFLWSGVFKPVLVVLGVISCLLTVYVVRRMGNFDPGVFAFRYNLRLIGFWFWLLREIARSSIQVARVVLRQPMRLNTEVVEVPVDDLDHVDQALLGNSITLTPGTLTLDTRQNTLTVHALTPEGAQALRKGEMKQRVAALRGNDSS